MAVNSRCTTQRVRRRAPGHLRRGPPERHVSVRRRSATSVLDLDCTAHDVDNLHVADAGFFVSSTAVNPTLTIIANALRVADRIAERLGSRLSDTAVIVTKSLT